MIRTLASAALVTLLAVPSSAMAGSPEPMTQAKARERYLAGQQLLLSDDFAGAADEFRAAIDLDPSMGLAHYGLGQANMGLKSYGEAVVAFRNCRAAYEDEAAYAMRQGERINKWVEDEIRGLTDTQRQLENALRQGGGREIQRQLARVAQRLEQLERMRQRQDRVHEAPAGVALALGSAYLRAGKLSEAEHEYQVALEGNPRMGEAHNNLAYVYMVTGRLPEAERALKQAEKNGFRVNPEFKAELKQKLQ